MLFKFTVRRKIIVLSVLMVCFALIVPGGWFFYEFYNTQINNAYTNINTSIEQLQSSVEKSFNSINNVSYAILSNQYIRDWINGDVSLNKNNKDFYLLSSQIQESTKYTIMFNEAWISKAISAGYIYTEGSYIELLPSRSTTIIRPQDLDPLIDKFKANSKSSTYYVPPTKGKTDAVLMKEVTDTNNAQKMYVFLSISQDFFVELLGNIPNQADVVITQNDVVFFSNNNELISTQQKNFNFTNRKISDSDTLFGMTKQINNTEFDISLTIPKSHFTQPVIQTLIGYCAVILILMFLFVIVTIIMLSANTKFLKDMLKCLNRVKEKDYDVKMPSYNERDLNIISLAFNQMTDETKNLIEKVYKSELSLKRAEIEQLQSQMNPHFLINTLATISTTALLHNDTMVYEMVSALNELLSANLYSLKNSTSFTTVKNELEYVKKYLFIQQIRFQDKFTYSIQVQDEKIMDLYIPRLTIQPLVENAIIHGIENQISQKEHIIFINAFINGDDLIFTVADDGCGFNVDDVFTQKEKSSKGHHLGVLNTHNRLILSFGNKYGLNFKSHIDIGTEVTINLPVIEHIDLPIN